MPTILAKRMRAEVKSAQENAARARILVAYITSDHDEDGKSKCTQVKAVGFSGANHTLDEMAEIIVDDMELPRLRTNELITHWVFSFRGDDLPGNEEAFQAAREHMEALGYTQAHRQIYAMHENTDHLHIHIAACKVDQWSGKILNEGKGWYKRESQRALVRIAERHGWKPEAGNIFNRKKKKPRTHRHNERAQAMESHTGQKSEQAKLTEMLAQFLEEHEDDFPRWKFGHFHLNLARLGIECRRTEVKPGAYGIVFSLDGETFCKASTVCRELTHSRLLQKLNAKSWRDARPETRPILEEGRRKLNRQLEEKKRRTRPMWQTRRKKRWQDRKPPQPIIKTSSATGETIQEDPIIIFCGSNGEMKIPEKAFIKHGSPGSIIKIEDGMVYRFGSNGEIIKTPVKPEKISSATGEKGGHESGTDKGNNKTRMESNKRRRRPKL